MKRETRAPRGSTLVLTPVKAAVLAVLLALPLSCGAKRTNLTDLPFDAPSRIASENRIALVTDPYISLRDKSGNDGITVAHGRRGEIYQITGVSLVKTDGGLQTWFNLGEGWVLSSSVQIYSDRSKAESAAASLSY